VVCSGNGPEMYVNDPDSPGAGPVGTNITVSESTLVGFAIAGAVGNPVPEPVNYLVDGIG